MGFRDRVARAQYRLSRMLARPDLAPMPPFELFEGNPGLRRSQGALADLFYAHDGRVIHKWDHYLPIYQHYFARFQGTPVRMLEIGVSHGGSLELWRKFLGPAAMIYGVDLDPRCAALDRPDLPVRIGSQADPAFLKGVVAEMGGVDLVLDDGSHRGSDQKVSFDTLFPLLSRNGLYVTEDLHAAYWPGLMRGGYRRPGTSIEQVKDLIDRMHGWYYRKNRHDPARTDIDAIHVHDSIVVIEKTSRDRPFHVKVGQAST